MNAVAVKEARASEVERCTARVRQLIEQGVSGRRLEAAHNALDAARARRSKAESRAAELASLKGEVARGKALAEQQRMKALADAAEAALRQTGSPTAVVSYGDLQVVIRLDVAGVDPRYAGHALMDAVTAVRGHFTTAVGLARARSQGRDAAVPKPVTLLADLLRDQLRVAGKFGVVSIDVKESQAKR